MKLLPLSILAAAVVVSADSLVSYSHDGDTVFKTTNGVVTKNTADNRHSFVASTSAEALNASPMTGDFTTSDGSWTAAANDGIRFGTSNRFYTFPGTCQCGGQEVAANSAANGYCGGQGTGLCGYRCNQDQEGGFTHISTQNAASDHECAEHCDNVFGCVAWVMNPQATVGNCWLSSTKPTSYGPGVDGQRNTGLASGQCP